MNDLFLEDSYQFDTDVLESGNIFLTSVDRLQIQRMSSIISESVYLEGTIDSITEFFKSVIKKIKELADKIDEKIRDKMFEMKFQKTCTELKRAYLADKTAFEGKKVTVFDYVKYTKRAHDLIREYYKVFSELDKRDWKSEEELERYIDKMVKKMEIQDRDCYVEREIQLFIDSADAYMKTILNEKRRCKDEILKVIDNAQRIMDKKKKEAPKRPMTNEGQKKDFFLFRFVKRIVNIFSSLASKILRGFGDGAWKVVVVAAGLAVLTAV